MPTENVVRESVCKGVEIGEIHPVEAVDHQDILVGLPGGVKNGRVGGVAQLAEAGRLNRPQ